jgi:hypothetical protein
MKCPLFLLKIGEELILIIKERKKIKLVKFIFTTHLSAFGSNMFLAMKIMNFENMLLNMIKKTWMHNINDVCS